MVISVFTTLMERFIKEGRLMEAIRCLLPVCAVSPGCHDKGLIRKPIHVLFSV